MLHVKLSSPVLYFTLDIATVAQLQNSIIFHYFIFTCLAKSNVKPQMISTPHFASTLLCVQQVQLAGQGDEGNAGHVTRQLRVLLELEALGCKEKKGLFLDEFSLEGEIM